MDRGARLLDEGRLERNGAALLEDADGSTGMAGGVSCAGLRQGRSDEARWAKAGCTGGARCVVGWIDGFEIMVGKNEVELGLGGWWDGDPELGDETGDRKSVV